ncbi:MAG: tyrosine-type recombinase/integrase [Caldilineaceae bacterium]|nr:tyrosine-type recombinase/integrase [Caldilineaceae bacterium]
MISIGVHYANNSTPVYITASNSSSTICSIPIPLAPICVDVTREYYDFMILRQLADSYQTNAVFIVLKAYVDAGDVLSDGYLLRGSSKSGDLTDERMSIRAINNRVRVLGGAVGIDGLSPHDCRHYWATRAIQKGTDPFALMQAGGWNSLSTVRRYVDENEVANDGVSI